MTLVVSEGMPSREVTLSERPSSRFNWFVLGTDNRDFAVQCAMNITPAMDTVHFPDGSAVPLFRQEAHAEETAPQCYAVTVIYGPRKPPQPGDWSIQFDFTATTQHVTQAKEHLRDYAAPATAPDWATGTKYRVGERVIYEGYAIGDIFTCAVAHTAGSFYTDKDAGKWTTVRTAWGTSTSYGVLQRVLHGGVEYACAAPHTSGTFADDLAAGKWTTVATNHHGQIGVDDQGNVAGVDVMVPTYTWNEQWQLSAAEVDQEYTIALADLIACTNQSSFRGFPAGEILFTGSTGSLSLKNPTVFEASFKFARHKTLAAETIGQLVGVDVGPWEYVWFEYQKKKDESSKRKAMVAVEAHVERLYDPGDYDLLNIGD